MCTVTLIARRQGYCLGMNRDEQRTRAIGLPPRERTINGRKVMGPTEPGGGTWIAVDETGVTLALINWYAITTRVKGKTISRGKIINHVSGLGSADLVETALRKLALKRVNPFRLLGIFPVTKEVREWRWDLKALVMKRYPWKMQQWVSSGFDEAEAQRVRGKIFRRALGQSSAGGREWLRRLHRSHLPEKGPFSTCMHRADAVTVSYTEVAVGRGRAELLHYAGCPCETTEGVKRAFPVSAKMTSG